MKCRTVVVLLLVVLSLGLASGVTHILPFLGTFLNVGAQPQSVDCVMALPGDDERRPFVAAAMINVGLAETLVIPKNEDSPDVIDGIYPASAEMAQRIYRARGIATERIVVLEGATTSTAGDLSLLSSYLESRPGQRAGIVTSGFHTRRTRWTIRERMPHQASRVIVISAPNPKFDEATWWRSNTGFRYVILEYAKLGYYWFRYGSGIGWLAISVMGAGAILYLKSRVGQKGSAPALFTAPTT